jgi:hypothetical protein
MIGDAVDCIDTVGRAGVTGDEIDWDGLAVVFWLRETGGVRRRAGRTRSIRCREPLSTRRMRETGGWRRRRKYLT